MRSSPTLLFDLDGTLADTAPDLCHTMNVLLARHGRPAVPEARVRHMVGGGARKIMERGFDETGAPASPALLDQLFDEFIAHYGANIALHSRVWPGLLPHLERFHANGVKMGVCTNKVEDLSRKLLAALNIADYFPVVIGGDTLAVKKPDPAHLLEAIRRLGGEAASTVMIGDSAPDIEAATAAGLPSICVSFGYTRTPPQELGATILIDHFDELPAALARLLPAHFERLA